MLARWWLHTRNGQDMPRRSDLDPSAFPPLLPHVWLLDYVPEQDNYRYRLAGEHVNEVFGFSLRGKWITDVVAQEMCGIIRNRFDHVLWTPGVCHAQGSVYERVGRHREGERLILPLASQSGEAMHVLGATIYNYRQTPLGTASQASRIRETLLSLTDFSAWETDLLAPVPR